MSLPVVRTESPRLQVAAPTSLDHLLVCMLCAPLSTGARCSTSTVSVTGPSWAVHYVRPAASAQRPVLAPLTTPPSPLPGTSRMDASGTGGQVP